MADTKKDDAKKEAAPASEPGKDDILARALTTLAAASDRLASREQTGPAAPTEGLFVARGPAGIYKVQGVLRNAHGDQVDESGNVVAANQEA